ncbi:fimbria/pilus periplasmic chaperone [Escherichia coli]
MLKAIQRYFSLRLDTTRVVYNQGSSGETLAVINEHDYPILVQAEVLLEDQRTPAPFVITPPLFRLDALQSSRLRIIQTGGDFPTDRETLQWVCIKGDSRRKLMISGLRKIVRIKIIQIK